jgi:hypothetical protein
VPAFPARIPDLIAAFAPRLSLPHCLQIIRCDFDNPHRPKQLGFKASFLASDPSNSAGISGKNSRFDRRLCAASQPATLPRRIHAQTQLGHFDFEAQNCA